MNRKNTVVIVMSVVMLFASLAIGADSQKSSHFGIGANYWKAVKDIDVQNVDKNGMSWLLTYKYAPDTLLKLEADLEVFKKGFAGVTENVYAPQAYVILGAGLYAGLGIGTYYADGGFADSPFYAFKAGLDLELLPSIWLDINANYRFNEWGNLGDVAENISTDTVTIGAALRLAF